MTRTIVVANDDQAFLDMIVELLNEEGYPDVITALGTQGAYDVVREYRPAVVLLDVNVANPGTSWAALDRITLDPTTSHIPVIICSTDTRLPREKAEWLQAHGCDFLEKPFNLDDLCAKLVATIGPPGP